MKTFTSITKTGSGAWTYTWTGTGPYRVAVDQQVLEEMWPLTSYTVNGSDAEEPPVLEVCEQGETLTSEAYPRRPTMQWFGNPRATSYNIYVDAAYWDTVPEDGRGYYQYSGFTDEGDGAEIDATLVQVDANGNESAAVAFQWLSFRYPDAPLVTYTYASVTGTFTSSERA